MKKLLSVLMASAIVLSFLIVVISADAPFFVTKDGTYVVEGHINVGINEEYCSKNRVYTPEDFPELGDIEDVRMLGESRDGGYPHLLCLTVSSRGEEALLGEIEALKKNPQVEFAEFDLVALFDTCRGDVNMDQNVNVRDAAMMARALAGWEPTVFYYYDVQDYNEDGVFNVRDLADLMRDLASGNGPRPEYI